MIKRFINEKSVNKADAVIISAPYEKTASFHKGTKNGPKKIIECLDNQIEFFDRKFKVEVNDYIKTAHVNLGNLNKLSPVLALKRIRENSAKIISQGKFPFLLGGEHSVSLGLLQALAKKHKPKDITILHVDAHCDLRNDDSDYSSSPSHLAHSAVMRRASELGYKIVQVGIRTYCRDEYKYFSNKKNNIKVFEWSHPAKKPEKGQILKAIKTKYIY